MSSYTRGASGRGGRKPRSEDPEVRISKALSYILRHGAEKEGLRMRKDGYIKVSDLLARPKLRGVDFPLLEKLVKENDKQRYQLMFEPSTPAEQGDTTIQTTSDGTWWIRANQGHTLRVEELELREIKSPDEVPVVVHGTTHEAWKSIEKEGLSKMQRNHIHMATGKLGDEGVISGMRASHAKSGVLIFVDVSQAMEDGIKFFISANGVVLTSGNDKGILEPKYFERVEDASGTVLYKKADTG